MTVTVQPIFSVFFTSWKPGLGTECTFIKQVMKRGFVKNAARRAKAVPSTVSGRRAAPKRRPEGRFKGESEASLGARCMGAHCQLSFKKKSFLMENN